MGDCFNKQELHFQATQNTTIAFFIKTPLLVFHAFVMANLRVAYSSNQWIDIVVLVKKAA
jgi:hypothetical protein